MPTQKEKYIRVVCWCKHWTTACKLKFKCWDIEKKLAKHVVVSSGTPWQFHNFLSWFNVDG